MSATLGFKAEDAAILFTDRAVYDSRFVVCDLVQKVTKACFAPLAVTTRGSEYWGDIVADTIINWADEVGVDEAVATFAGCAERRIYGFNPDLNNHLEVVIACLSPTVGPQLLVWRNVANRKVGEGGVDDGLATVDVLEDAGKSFLGIGSVGEALPSLRTQEPGEDVLSYAAFVGKTIMEHARRTLLPPSSWDAGNEPKYIVGGGVDMTIVNESGVEIRPVLDWPDKIGERINPFSDAGNVSPLAHAKPVNRQRELALKALRMKRSGRR